MKAMENKLLIVDDDTDFLEELAEGFDALDVPYVTASEAQEAVRLFAADPLIDTALIDVNLRDNNGVDLLEKLQNWSSSRPLCSIMLTAGGGLENVVRSLRMKATDFLQKPVSAHEIMRIVERAREERRVQQKKSRQPFGAIEDISLLKIAINAASNRYIVARDMAEGAWLILIEAAVYHLQNMPLFVTSACIASGAPISSAVRYVNDLEDNGLIRRMPDLNDGRRTNIVITQEGLQLVGSYTKRLRKRLGFLDDAPVAAVNAHAV